MNCIKLLLMRGIILGACITRQVHALDEPDREKPPKLNGELFALMDANSDAKVSKAEFLEFGAEALKQRGRTVDVYALENQFLSFDRNEDGFITAEDPDAKSPIEMLNEKIIGTWSGTKENGNDITFVFMDGSKADLVQRGVSMREKAIAAGGDMTFVFVDPNKEPIGLNLVAKGQEGSPTEIQCIIRFTSDDQMQLRMAGGGRFARRPSEFPKGASLDTLVLNRLK